MKKIFLIFVLLCAQSWALSLGDVPKDVTIEGDNGGLVAGGAWNSSMLQGGKVHVIFYVDPDEKDVNEDFADALKSVKFDHDKFQTIAIVNMAATWKPNMIIAAILKSKQKKFPEALYVKDKKKILVKMWDLQDDNSDILVFDKSGKLLYTKAGKLDKTEIQKVISLIKEHL